MRSCVTQLFSRPREKIKLLAYQDDPLASFYLAGRWDFLFLNPVSHKTNFRSPHVWVCGIALQKISTYRRNFEEEEKGTK